MYSLAARREFIDDINDQGFKYKHVILTFDYFTRRPVTLGFSEEEDHETEKYVLRKIKEIQRTESIYRVIGRGDFNWRCKCLCDTAVCSKVWNGPFRIGD